jgi:hypothetical protein
MNLDQLISLVENDEIGTVFFEIETQELKSTALVRLRKEFEQGIRDVNFHDRLKTALRSASRNRNNTTSSKPKKKILFLSANPIGLPNLRFDQEYKLIKEVLEQGNSHDQYELLPPSLALTKHDLSRIEQQQPYFIHFSGHGKPTGIVLTTEQNRSEILPNRSIERLFTPLKGIVKVVLFNNCYSKTQAEIISKFGIHVIGYNIAVDDSAAITFARGFYNGLGEGKTIKNAYNDAMIVSSSLEDKVAVWLDGNKLEW